MDETGSSAPQEDSPGIGLLIAAIFVGILFCGAFGVTGLFMAGLTKQLHTATGGMLFGLIPAVMTGLLVGGFVYSIHPPSMRRLLWVMIPFHLAPLILFPIYVTVNMVAMLTAPVGMLVGVFLGPKIVFWWRGRERKDKNYPPGSWEENF